MTRISNTNKTCTIPHFQTKIFAVNANNLYATDFVLLCLMSFDIALNFCVNISTSPIIPLDIISCQPTPNLKVIS